MPGEPWAVSSGCGGQRSVTQARRLRWRHRVRRAVLARTHERRTGRATAAAIGPTEPTATYETDPGTTSSHLERQPGQQHVPGRPVSRRDLHRRVLARPRGPGPSVSSSQPSGSTTLARGCPAGHGGCPGSATGNGSAGSSSASSTSSSARVATSARARRRSPPAREPLEVPRHVLAELLAAALLAPCAGTAARRAGASSPPPRRASAASRTVARRRTRPRGRGTATAGPGSRGRPRRPRRRSARPSAARPRPPRCRRCRAPGCRRARRAADGVPVGLARSSAWATVRPCSAIAAHPGLLRRCGRRRGR